MRAHGKRVAESDPEALAELLELHIEIAHAIETGVHGLRAAGYSWTEIGRPMGLTKQAAHNRWGNK
ncbi:hypothetical protein GCM10027289_30110 [Tsukamurella serpentis]